MDYKLHRLLKTALVNYELPLVLNAAATKAACEHDILLIENRIAEPEVMTSQSGFLGSFNHRRLCQQVLAAANHAINENHRLEVSGQMLVQLVAMLIVLDNATV